MSGTTNSSIQVVVIIHLILLFYILSIIPWIIFEGSMTAGALHFWTEHYRVLACHYEAFIIDITVIPLVLKLDHYAGESLKTVDSMDDAKGLSSSEKQLLIMCTTWNVRWCSSI